MTSTEGAPQAGAAHERRAPGRARRDLLHQAVRETGADWTVLRRREADGAGWEMHLDAAYADAVASRLGELAGEDRVAVDLTGTPIVTVVLRD